LFNKRRKNPKTEEKKMMKKKKKKKKKKQLETHAYLVQLPHEPSAFCSFARK